MTEPSASHEKAFATNTLKTAGMVVLMYGIAIGLDLGSEQLVELKYLRKDSLIYYSFQAVSGLIKLCETLVISAIILRHTYDGVRKALKV